MASNEPKVKNRWEIVFTDLFKKALDEDRAEFFKHLKHKLLDGFETFADYEKYGDMFEHADTLESKPVEYTPYIRQLTQGTKE